LYLRFFGDITEKKAKLVVKSYDGYVCFLLETSHLNDRPRIFLDLPSDRTCCTGRTPDMTSNKSHPGRYSRIILVAWETSEIAPRLAMVSESLDEDEEEEVEDQ
jgi:hypothetical protein